MPLEEEQRAENPKILVLVLALALTHCMNSRPQHLHVCEMRGEVLSPDTNLIICTWKPFFFLLFKTYLESL